MTEVESVWAVEETRVPEKTPEMSQVTGKLYHLMLYRVHIAFVGFELTMLVVIGTPRYNMNIVESGVKYHTPSLITY
jgi:hypothetical protein